MNRKRSSRLAVRESEKEIARLAAAKQAEEEERMSRTRRLEARARKEEEERLSREKERERRRIEREERELARRRRAEDDESVCHWLRITEISDYSYSLKNGLSANASEIHPSNCHPRITTPSAASSDIKELVNCDRKTNDDWELNCEVCGTKGVNKVIFLTFSSHSERYLLMIRMMGPPL